MGSFVETNDTLQLTHDQGFPVELTLEKHLTDPFKTENFTDKIFSFTNKPKIRIYQQPPIRVFLVENRNGKWIYWGLIYIIEILHDYIRQTTSGKYKIVYIYSPEEMKNAHKIVDRKKDTNYF